MLSAHLYESEVSDLARTLIRLGASINRRDEALNGATPLIVAVKQQVPSIVRLLIEEGAQINLVNQSGKTPLHYACKLGK